MQVLDIQFRPSTPNGQPIVANFAGIDSLSFDVLALRRGEALQRWKEISLNVPQNYRAQIKDILALTLVKICQVCLLM